MGLAANWPTWPGDPNRIRTGDLDLMASFVAWTPYALAHGHNLFATTWLNYPRGVNLAQNTATPLLGLLMTPLTLLAGPLATLNLLLWLAYVLSASAMYLALRRLRLRRIGAFAGGCLYGFSPYMVAQGRDHLHLVFVPLPPLMLLATYELLRPSCTHTIRWGLALGLLTAAQFLISAEVAATTVIVAVLAMVLRAATTPREVIPVAKHSVGGLGTAFVVAVASLAYPVWEMLAGPYRYRGPAFPGGVSADLLGTVIPTQMQRAAPHVLSAYGSRLLSGNLTENSSYLGIPLLILLVTVVIWCHNRPWVRLAAVMVAIATVFSLGPHLIVGNHVTAVPLPWALLQHLPLMDNVMAVRMSLYAGLFASVLIAIGIDSVQVTSTQVRNRVAQAENRTRVRTIWTLVGIATLSLIPAWPLPTTSAGIPPYFMTKAVEAIRPGSVVLISPYPSVEEVQPQLWQAEARMRFRIIGGYVLDAGPDGSMSPYPAVLEPTDVERFLWATATGGPPYPPGPVPRLTFGLICDVQRFVLKYNVEDVLSLDVGANPQTIDALFSRALGPPSVARSDLEAWYDVPQHLRTALIGRRGCPGA